MQSYKNFGICQIATIKSAMNNCHLRRQLKSKKMLIPFACPQKSITFAVANAARGVAQLVSAPRSGRGGRKFESSHPDSTI